MKIKAITPYIAWIGIRNQLLVKIEANNGVFGWGESGLSARELAVEGAIKHYREFLTGKDPRRIGALWQEMYRSQYFEGGRTLTAAISAIDIALHDLVAKSLGLPVYQLLGGAQRDRIDCFATIPSETPVEEIPGMSTKLMAAGWKSFRLGFTAPRGASYEGNGGAVYDVREACDRTIQGLLAAREAAGSEAMIGCDPHHRLSIAEAASFLQRIPFGTLDYVEDPIRAESPEAYEALRRLTTVPFAIGEEFSSKWAFKPFIERGLLQLARLDVCNVGGLTESTKVAAMCEANYIDLLLHNPLGPICTAASIHLAAAIPNFSHLECLQSPSMSLPTTDENIITRRHSVEGHAYMLPTGPGLGIEINEAALREQTFKPWEPPRLWRADGSYTNW